MKTVVEVNELTKVFKSGNKSVHAVNGVDLKIEENEIVALVGESGCGKSTLGRMLVKLERPTSGNIKFLGYDINECSEEEYNEIRFKLQMVFQNVSSCFNPRKNVYSILEKPFKICKKYDSKQTEAKIHQMLKEVHLDPQKILDKFPHELSVGERQRLNIVRAISLEPEFVVADEPISSIDVINQLQILNLFKGLKEKYHIAILFISHDLAVVRSLANKVYVMYSGKFVENGKVEDIFLNPLHPYTKSLLSSVPIHDPVKARKRERILLQGEIPSLEKQPDGCKFHPRCPYVKEICKENSPAAKEIEQGHTVYCWLYDET